MVLLILESLGSTELIFILVMALVFFGPRKLPQLSRTLGKNLASFRRASEDFKRTWEREVTVEELNFANPSSDSTRPIGENSIADNVSTLQPPTIEAVSTDRVVPRESFDQPPAPEATDAIDHSAHSPKREWL